MFLLTCTPISELPFYTSIMLQKFRPGTIPTSLSSMRMRLGTLKESLLRILYIVLEHYKSAKNIFLKSAKRLKITGLANRNKDGSTNFNLFIYHIEFLKNISWLFFSFSFWFKIYLVGLWKHFFPFIISIRDIISKKITSCF